MTMTDPFLTLVSEVLEIPLEQVGDDTGPATFGGWTSLKHVQLVAAIEDIYRVDFSPREIRSIGTVGKLREILGYKGIKV